MSAEHAALVVIGLCLASFVMAEEDAMPEADFLEYLGSWQGSDEDWLMLEETRSEDSQDERSVLVPEVEASVETENGG